MTGGAQQRMPKHEFCEFGGKPTVTPCPILLRGTRIHAALRPAFGPTVAAPSTFATRLAATVSVCVCGRVRVRVRVRVRGLFLLVVVHEVLSVDAARMRA